MLFILKLYCAIYNSKNPEGILYFSLHPASDLNGVVNAVDGDHVGCVTHVQVLLLGNVVNVAEGLGHDGYPFFLNFW